MLVVWMMVHGLGFGSVSHYSDQALILRGTFRKIRIERERRDVRRRTFRLFSGLCGVSSVLDGLDEHCGVGVTIDARLFGLSVSGHIGYAAHTSKRFFDRLLTVAAGHSSDGDNRRHTSRRTRPSLMRVLTLNCGVVGGLHFGNEVMFALVIYHSLS